MSRRSEYNLPQEKQQQLERARRLEWITIGFILSIVLVMYFAMGSSQAMKTAWVEDMLSLIPPIVLLISLQFRGRKPNKRFPYGYRRSTLLSFLIAAAAIFMVGLYLFYDSVHSLVLQQHASLGHINLFGHPVWSGWVMIVALIYSMIPPLVLGHMKLKLAKDLHEKTLYADAHMNKADWMTSAAAVVGVLGISLGFWWADALAAIFISLDVMKDGVSNVKRAMSDLMDSQPRSVSTGKPLGMEERIEEALQRSPLVEKASARLREEGLTICGEVFVELKGQRELGHELMELSRQAAAVDWRVHNIIIMPVEKLKQLDD